jgi:archaellum component FlaC
MKEKFEPFDDDFGFNFVDEDFEEVKTQAKELQANSKSDKEMIDDLQHRLEVMFNSINPFLENLKSNPEKTTIYWPNRTAKIESFQTRLKAILEG